jgi:PAS domain S-box-containing protein
MDRNLRFLAPPRLRAAIGYTAAVGAPVLASLLQLQLRRSIDAVPFMLFFFAVTAASWFGGLGPGLLAIACSALLANVYFLEPYGVAATSTQSILITALFLGVSAVITLITASLRTCYFERERLIEKEREALARAEEAERRVTDEGLRRLLESVDDYAIFQLDPTGRIVTWNLGAERIIGYQANEIIGQHFSKFYTAEDLQGNKPERELEHALRHKRVEDEGWGVRKDGSRFWANVVVTALHDSTGALRGFAKLTRDLTARRRVEEEARLLRIEQAGREAAEEARHLAERAMERTARLQALTESFSAALTVQGVAQTVLTEFTPSVRAKATGVWLKSPDGKAIELVASRGFSPESQKAFQQLDIDAQAPVADAVRTGAPVWLESCALHAAKFPALEAAGRSRDSETAIAYLPLATGGAVLGALSFSFSNVSEMDQQERTFLLSVARQCAQALDRARLYENEQKAHFRSKFLAKASAALVESLDHEKTLQTVVRLAVPQFADWAAVDLLDEDGSIRRVAVAHVDKAKVELGWELFHKFPPKREDTVGVANILRTGKSEFVAHIPDSLLVEVIGDPELLEIARAQKLSSSIIVPMNVRGRTLGAITFVLAESNRRYTLADVALAEELGIRAAASVENARLYRNSVEASRLKDEFLSTLSHELRTPLTAILGWARILVGNKLPEDKRVKAVEIIARNATTQAQLIDDMLDISRIITGKMRLDVQSINPLEVIEAAIDSVHLPAETKMVRIQTAVDPEAGLIIGDPARLQQIIWNLLTNAIKFTPKGGRVLVQLTRINSQIEIEVSDTGEGIALEFLPFVFDRFRQGDASSSRPHGGLGLGLSIVRHLVELHGGTVDATSKGVGKGATFRVKLPLLPARHSPTEETLRKDPVSSLEPLRFTFSSELNGLRVLVVDDQEDARELIKEVLARCKADVTCVGDAAKAEEALNGAAWDVLLSDLGMPGEDGYSLIRKVRMRDPRQGGEIRAVAITAYARLEDRTQALHSGFDAHVAKPINPIELVEVVANLIRRGRSPTSPS